MFKRQPFNIIKRKFLPRRENAKRLPFWSRQAGFSFAKTDWVKQLQGIEKLGSGLVVMRMG